MSKVLIVGAGGVGSVAVRKAAQFPEVFSEIWLASRTLSKCDAIASDLRAEGREIRTAALDADNVAGTVALLERVKPEVLINLALPYQDLPLMDACLEAGVHYVDTANYEPRDVAKFEYKWQWAYQERFERAGLTALLGCGFDPGVTNVFCAHAAKHLFDTIRTVDILDANAGDHGRPFATNFNPEINLREITQRGRYWERGEWKETEPLSVHVSYPFPDPQVGSRDIYLIFHEELESLAQNLPGLERIRFWMTFSQNYLTHLRVLQNVGMTSIEPVLHHGHPVVPIEFLKTLLPDPASLGPDTVGKTCIGCLVHGVKDGKELTRFIYNLCDHQACYRELKSQAISYTAGVPPVVGAKQLISGAWLQPGVWNLEQLDPDPFMEDLPVYGLPWQVHEADPMLLP
jgi:saccharopine dehydrogenase (NAD+, L-lysine-forming)